LGGPRGQLDELTGDPIDGFLPTAEDNGLGVALTQHPFGLLGRFQKLTLDAFVVKDDNGGFGVVVESHRRFHRRVVTERITLLLRVGEVENEVRSVRLGVLFVFLGFLVPVGNHGIEQTFTGNPTGYQFVNQSVTPVIVGTSATEENELLHPILPSINVFITNPS